MYRHPFEPFEFDFDNGPEAQDLCELYAPLLTTLFDGEASLEQERLVRAHLAHCARCAALWRQWRHTRYLLRTAPLPPLPPGLLTRVLMACRLSAWRRQAQQGTQQSRQMPQTSRELPHLRLLGSSGDVTASPSAASPSASSETSSAQFSMLATPALSHLHDEILRLTVGVAADSQEQEARVAQRDGSRPKALNAWVKQAARFAAATAVPATVAWLLVMAQRPAPFTSESALTTRQLLPLALTTPARIGSRGSDSQAAIIAQGTASAPHGAFDARRSRAASATVASATAVSAMSSGDEAPARTARSPVSPSGESGTGAPGDLAHSAPGATQVMPAPLSMGLARFVSSPTVQQRERFAVPEKARGHLPGLPGVSKPAALSVMPYVRPRAIVVRWDRRGLMPRISTGSGMAAAGGNRRNLLRSPQLEVLSTVAMNMRAQRGGSQFADGLAARPAPVKQTEVEPLTPQADVDAAAVDEEWEEVHHLGDNRPDAVQQIVDDYRWSLLDEDPESIASPAAGSAAGDS